MNKVTKRTMRKKDRKVDIKLRGNIKRKTERKRERMEIIEKNPKKQERLYR